MKILASGFAIALSLVSQQALAQKWTGAHIAIGGGGGITATNADVTVAAIGIDDPVYSGCYPSGLCAAPHQVDYLDSEAHGAGPISGAGAFASIELGYDYRVNRDVVVGAFINFDAGSDQADTITGTGNWQLVEAGGTIPLPGYRIAASGSTTATASVATHNAASIGARIGYLVHPKTMIYVLGGYSATRAEMQFSMDIAPLGLASRYAAMQTRTWRGGFVLGAGVEAKLSSRFSAKLEYRYADYGSYGFADHADFVIPVSPAYPYRLQGEVTGGVQANSLRNNSLRLMFSMRL